jgi:DNA-binding CsgD family transcriptional regulator
MNGHHTKRTGRSQSQIGPIVAAQVASDMTYDDAYVLLCDWHGKLVWKSTTAGKIQVGDFVWKNACPASRDQLKSAIAHVITLREPGTCEMENEWNEHFRIRMWPLDEPDVALCALAKKIPSELALLTEREKSCLRLLAQGKSTRDIAKELEIGLTTVHTHLRRTREKLGLGGPEALVSFAARYFYVPTPPRGEDFGLRKRSG